MRVAQATTAKAGPEGKAAPAAESSVTSRPASAVPAGWGVLALQRQCACGGQDEDCECQKGGGQSPKRRSVQRSPEAGDDSGGEIPASVYRVLGSPGRPLGAGILSFMEPRFGHDFGDVQLHTGPAAAASAREVGARAYTVGSHIVMGGGAPSPETGAGRELLAHELTHVVQQSRGGLTPGIDPDAAHERSARSVASTVAAGGTAPGIAGMAGTGIGLARDDKKDPAASPPAGPPPGVNPVKPEVRAALLGEMQADLAAARAAAPPVSTQSEQARRTFAVAKIIDDKGGVTTVPGEFLKSGDPHAEQSVLAKAQSAGLLKPGYTMLLMIDQLPCTKGPNCDATLLKQKDDPQNGSLRVYTISRYKKDFSGQPTDQLASPKTTILGKDDPANPKFYVEMTEYRRVRLPLYQPPPEGAQTPPTTPPSPPAGPSAGTPPPEPAAAPGKAPAAGAPAAAAPAKPPAGPGAKPAAVPAPAAPGSTPAPAAGKGTAPGAAGPGPSTVAKVAVGGVMALQMVNGALVKIGDHIQRKAAMNAYFVQLTAAKKAIAKTPGTGAIIFLYFEQQKSHLDSAIHAGDLFLDATWNFANGPNDYVEIRPYYPGKQFRREAFWVPPEVPAKAKADAGTPGAAPGDKPKPQRVRITSSDDFVTKTAGAAGDTVNWAVKVLAALQGASPGVGWQDVTVGGVIYEVENSTYYALIPVVKALAGAELKKHLKNLEGRIESEQARLSKYGREDAFFRWLRDRKVDLDPHALDSPRAHAASAAISIKDARYRDALNSIRSGFKEVDAVAQKTDYYVTGSLE